MKPRHEGTAVVHLHHQALALKQRERLTNRRLADAQLLGDPRFDDPFTRQDLAPQDGFPQECGDLIPLGRRLQCCELHFSLYYR